MNIVYLEHYAGSDRHGMEYRPYYMARRWVQAGDTVTMVASAWSHMRGKNPELGGVPYAEEDIDGIRYFWIKGPQYEGNGLGRIKNILSFLRGVYQYEKEILKTGKPDVVIASSTYPLDIYPAREEPIPGVSSRIIFDKVTIPSKTLCKKEELLDVVAAGKYEVVLMVGAGNIDRLVEPVKEILCKQIRKP